MSIDEFIIFAQMLCRKFIQELVALVKPISEGGGFYSISANNIEKIGEGKISLDQLSKYYSRLRKGKHKGRFFYISGVRIPSNSISAMMLSKKGYII